MRAAAAFSTSLSTSGNCRGTAPDTSLICVNDPAESAGRPIAEPYDRGADYFSIMATAAGRERPSERLRRHVGRL